MRTLAMQRELDAINATTLGWVRLNQHGTLKQKKERARRALLSDAKRGMDTGFFFMYNGLIHTFTDHTGGKGI